MSSTIEEENNARDDRLIKRQSGRSLNSDAHDSVRMPIQYRLSISNIYFYYLQHITSTLQNAVAGREEKVATSDANIPSTEEKSNTLRDTSAAGTKQERRGGLIGNGSNVTLCFLSKMLTLLKELLQDAAVSEGNEETSDASVSSTATTTSNSGSTTLDSKNDDEEKSNGSNVVRSVLF